MIKYTIHIIKNRLLKENQRYIVMMDYTTKITGNLGDSTFSQKM